MDIRVPASLHLSALVATVLDRKNNRLLCLVNDVSNRDTYRLILRTLISLPYNYPVHGDTTVNQSTLPCNGDKRLGSSRTRIAAERLCPVCDQVRVGIAHLRCRIANDFLGSTVSSIIPPAPGIGCGQRAAIHLFHESVKTSDDPRREHLRVLHLSWTSSDRRTDSSGLGLSCF